MSRVGKNVGKAVGTVFRGTGALIAGTAGVASHIIGFGASTMSGELGDGFSQIGNACFDFANTIWTGKETKSNKINFNAHKAKIELLLSKEEQLQSFINNKDTQKRWLEKNGLNPAIADDPEFTRYLQKKADQIMKETKENLGKIVP